MLINIFYLIRWFVFILNIKTIFITPLTFSQVIFMENIKITENFRFSYVFSGYKVGTLARNGLNVFLHSELFFFTSRDFVI